MTGTAVCEDTPDDEDRESANDHLADVEAGAGCTEIWEHLSEQRGECSAD